MASAYGYNGDGQRVTLTTGCTTTTYVGAYFEWRGSTATMKSYYYAGGTRVAMRAGTPITGTVSYLLGDHLGSSSVSYRSDGGQTATQRYGPWGGVRATTGVLPTDYGFTGQKLDASAGLLYYGARYYDAALGRFIQADTIVPNPGDPQSLNRYSYVKNNPLRFTDPTGHEPENAPSQAAVDPFVQQALDFFGKLGWVIVGDPSKINPSWNGADLVFKAQDGQLLVVELKDVARNVDLGTLRWSQGFQDFGGSIDRAVRQAGRFENVQDPQLRLMSRTILSAVKEGKSIQNALFTSAPGVSANAQTEFNGVYLAGQGTGVQALKNVASPPQGFLGQLSQAASAAWSGIQAAGAALATGIASAPVLPPVPFVIIPREVLDMMPGQQQWD